MLDIQVLIMVCREQVFFAQHLAPDLLLIDWLDRAAAAMGCLVPRLPDSILELVINAVADEMESSLV